jgi:hypothetical protein
VILRAGAPITPSSGRTGRTTPEDTCRDEHHAQLGASPGDDSHRAAAGASPRAGWAERIYRHLLRGNDNIPRSGHFATFEQPSLFVAKLRNCFRTVQ